MDPLCTRLGVPYAPASVVDMPSVVDTYIRSTAFPSVLPFHALVGSAANFFAAQRGTHSRVHQWEAPCDVETIQDRARISTVISRIYSRCLTRYPFAWTHMCWA